MSRAFQMTSEGPGVSLETAAGRRRSGWVMVCFASMFVFFAGIGTALLIATHEDPGKPLVLVLPAMFLGGLALLVVGLRAATWHSWVRITPTEVTVEDRALFHSRKEVHPLSDYGCLVRTFLPKTAGAATIRGASHLLHGVAALGGPLGVVLVAPITVILLPFAILSRGRAEDKCTLTLAHLYDHHQDILLAQDTSQGGIMMLQSTLASASRCRWSPTSAPPPLLPG